jgi:hypothetical protein
MSRRSGQCGHIEVSGRWYVVRFWMDVLGREERRLVREKICPAKGPGRLSESERKRKAKEIIAASGADTVDDFEKVVASSLWTTFGTQADWWLNYMKTRMRKPLASSTYETWRCLGQMASPGAWGLALVRCGQRPCKGTRCQNDCERGTRPQEHQRVHQAGQNDRRVRQRPENLEAVVSGVLGFRIIPNTLTFPSWKRGNRNVPRSTARR